MPTYSTIRKAAAPMIGGMSWPLVEAATSTAPAFSAGKPTRFINGMVKVPVVTTLAMEEPEISPVGRRPPPPPWPARRACGRAGRRRP